MDVFLLLLLVVVVLLSLLLLLPGWLLLLLRLQFFEEHLSCHLVGSLLLLQCLPLLLDLPPLIRLLLLPLRVSPELIPPGPAATGGAAETSWEWLQFPLRNV